MTANTAVDAYFEALNESNDALIEALKAGTARGHRLSSTFLTEAQRNQHEMIELARTVAAEPANLRKIYRLLGESGERGRGRAREIRRQWTDELAQLRIEARAVFERVATQQRVAEDASVQLARTAFNSIIDRAQARIQRTVERAETKRQHAAPAQAEEASNERPDGAGDGADMSQAKRAEVGPDGESAPAWLTSSAARTGDGSGNPASPPGPRSTPRPDAAGTPVGAPHGGDGGGRGRGGARRRGSAAP